MTDYSLPAIPLDYAGLRVDQAVSRLHPHFSRSRLQLWIQLGHITVDGKRVACKMRLKGGEHLDFHPPQEHTLADPRSEDLPLDVVFFDDDLLVINKPAGLVMHPGAGRASGTLLNALLHYDPALAHIPRAGIVHRLDRDTSGLLVVARTLLAHTHLVRQLKDRTVTRVYHAVVLGHPSPIGVVESPIGRHPTQRTKMAVVSRGREARTHYRVLQSFAAASLLECRLDTGRTHQIRVHLASIGFGIIGDPTYGGAQVRNKSWLIHRQALHAHTLSLLHPRQHTTQTFSCTPPADFSELITRLQSNTIPAL